MALSREQIEYNRQQQELLNKRQEAEAKASSTEEAPAVSTPTTPEPVAAAQAPSTPTPQPTPSGGPSPEEVALGQRNAQGSYEATANTAQKQQREEGLITQAANGIGYLLNDATGDVLDGALGLLADNLPEGEFPAIEGLSQFVKSSGEIDQFQEDKAKQDAERRAAGEMNPVEEVLDTTLNSVTGVSYGMAGGLSLPATLAGRIANQKTPWADPPEVLKASPVGETIFEIAQIATPSLLIPGSGLGVAAFEGAIETTTQDSFDDLIAGRSMAGKFGEIANHMGLDGAQLTQDLIEGKTWEAQGMTTVVGFIQNTGINIAAEKVFGVIGKAFGRVVKPSQLDEKVAKLLKKTPEDVQAESAVKNEPRYTKDAEPADVESIDSAQRTATPPDGEWVNEPALIKEILRKNAIADDGLTAANREYLTNWDTITVKKGLQAHLQAATNSINKIQNYPKDLRLMAVRALSVWEDLKSSLEVGDLDGAAEKFRGYTVPFKETPDNLKPKVPEPDIDTRGQGEFYHGTANKIDQLGEEYYSNQNVYGNGLYTTDDVTTARAYTKKNKKSVAKDGGEVNQTVYKIKDREGKTNFYDLDAPVSPSVLKQLEAAADYVPALDEAMASLDYDTLGSRSLAEILDETRAYSQSSGTSRDTITEMMENLKDVLREEGFNGFTHAGGKLTKSGREHTVKIYWDAANEQLEELPPRGMTKSNNIKDIPTSAYLSELAAVSNDDPGMMTAVALVAEELGARMKLAALKADNLENIGVDFSKAVENLLDLQDKAALFLTPLRRGMRKFALSGMSLQRRFFRQMGDADISKIFPDDSMPFDASGRDLQLIKGVDGSNKNTIRELWDMYKEGDALAGQTLKEYVNHIAYGDPRTILTNVVDLTKTLTDQLKKGNRDARTALSYMSKLSRLKTQIKASLNSTFLVALDPMGNAAAGAPEILLKGDWGQSAYGLGTFIGGLTGMRASFRAYRKSLRYNDTFVKTGGVRFEADVRDLAQKQKVLEGNYANVKRKLNADPKATNMDKLTVWMAYTQQSLANNPLLGLGPRNLMAADESLALTRAHQVALGRALKEATDTSNFKDVGRLWDAHMKRIVNENGKIIDGEVLQSVRYLTFTENIGAMSEGLDADKGIYAFGNAIDNGFKYLDEGSKNNIFWNIASPFTRMSYGSLEAWARYEPLPILKQLHPRYKAIMDGKFGETAQLQLKSSIAIGQMFTFGTIGPALMNGTTGENPPNGLPKHSIILPNPSAKNGYTAISHEHMVPFSVIISTISDTVQGVRDKVIDQGTYEKFMSNMVLSIAMSGLDKTWQDGLQRFADIFDAESLKQGEIGTTVASIAGGFSPRFIDMVGDWVQPYKTLAKENDDDLFNGFRGFVKQSLGGIGLVPDYNVFTGKKIGKSATVGKDASYIEQAAGTIFEEIGWGGKSSSGTTDIVQENLYKSGYVAHLKPNYYRQYEGVNLSTAEQSQFKRGMHEYGELNARLKEYFSGKVGNYKTYLRDIEKERSKNPIAYGGVGTRSQGIRLKRIHTDISAIFNIAKKKSIKSGLLGNPAFPELEIKLRNKAIADLQQF